MAWTKNRFLLYFYQVYPNEWIFYNNGSYWFIWHLMVNQIKRYLIETWTIFSFVHLRQEYDGANCNVLALGLKKTLNNMPRRSVGQLKDFAIIYFSSRMLATRSPLALLIFVICVEECISLFNKHTGDFMNESSLGDDIRPTALSQWMCFKNSKRVEHGRLL
jgi:hypothetical protein